MQLRRLPTVHCFSVGAAGCNGVHCVTEEVMILPLEFIVVPGSPVELTEVIQDTSRHVVERLAFMTIEPVDLLEAN